VILTIPFQSCKNKNVDVKHDTIIKYDTIIKHDTVIKHDIIIKPAPIIKNVNVNNITKGPKKPNIYIYPKKEISLKVNIIFPKGGAILKSIPLYNNGWKIKVDSTGKINKTFDYLFYESTQPDNWQYTSGWIIEKDSLKVFFQNNLSEYGFNSKEIKDFTDYWIPRFIKYKYYLIYPQEKDLIDKLIQVNYSTKPDNNLRLFYAIKGTNNKLKMNDHLIKTSFKRDGFYITEWGVIIIK